MDGIGIVGRVYLPSGRRVEFVEDLWEVDSVKLWPSGFNWCEKCWMSDRTWLKRFFNKPRLVMLWVHMTEWYHARDSVSFPRAFVIQVTQSYIQVKDGWANHLWSLGFNLQKFLINWWWCLFSKSMNIFMDLFAFGLKYKPNKIIY